MSMEKAQASQVYYQAAGGVVAHEGKFLVLKRPGRGEVRLPKGHVDPGEDAPETALRETTEESGYSALEIIADLGTQRHSFFNPHKGVQVTRDNHFYLMRLLDAERRSGEEQFVPMWLTPAEAEAALTFDEEREFVRRAAGVLAEWMGD